MKPGDLSAACRSLAPGQGWRSLVRPGAAWQGLAQPGEARRSLAWPGEAWRGLAQPGEGWRSLAWPGEAWRGLSQPDRNISEMALADGHAEGGSDYANTAYGGNPYAHTSLRETVLGVVPLTTHQPKMRVTTSLQVSTHQDICDGFDFELLLVDWPYG